MSWSGTVPSDPLFVSQYAAVIDPTPPPRIAMRIRSLPACRSIATPPAPRRSAHCQKMLRIEANGTPVEGPRQSKGSPRHVLCDLCVLCGEWSLRYDEKRPFTTEHTETTE